MTRSMLPLTVAALLLGLTAAARATEPGAPDRLVTAEEAYAIKLHQALAAAIEGGHGAVRLSEEDRTALAAFYDKRDGKPFWTDGGKLTPGALSAIAAIGKAGDYALKAADYPVPAATLGNGGAPASPEVLANAELTLDVAALRYAHDAHVGRIEPEVVGNNIDRGSTPPNPGKVLEGLASKGDPGKYLIDFNPHHPQFELLRKKYLELSSGHPVAMTVDAAAEPDQPGVRLPAGPRLHPGDQHPQIALLRQRLNSPLPPDAAPGDETSYDDVLVEVVRKFQADHNLPDNGVIDAKLRKLLNASLPRTAGKQPAKQVVAGVANKQDIYRVLANLQRWRWMREDMGEFYVFDNVPEYLTRVVDHGKVIFTEKIVAGKPDTATPSFSQDMQTIEFNPFWNVPNSIKEKEILPKLRAGSDIMAVQNLQANYNGKPVDVYSIDWTTTDIKNFAFQQPPGKENVLGVVKFLFPNHFDVYMHDTPSKTLFNQTVRAYSHGCMRVHNPDQFAAVILGHDQGWSHADVQNAIATGQNQQVRLQTHIPVHVAYFTAWVEEDGSLATFNDIYGHDHRLQLAMSGQTDQLAREVAIANAKARAVPPDPGISDSAPNFLSLLFGNN